MCGRFTLFTDFEQLVERFDIDMPMEDDWYTPNYNVAPSQSIVSVINDGTSNRLGTLRWGLIPNSCVHAYG